MERLYDGKEYRNMTPTEAQNALKAMKEIEVQERHRLLSDNEIFNLIVYHCIQKLTVDDITAIRMRNWYPKWDSLIGQTAIAGMKFTYENELYEVNMQPNQHKFQSDWIPGKGTESLYRLIPEYYAGDIYDPIPYKGNMELEKGKYYIQNDIKYLCIRNSEIPVYDSLESMIDLYVKQI